MSYDLANVKLKAADITTIKPTKQEEDQTREGMAFLVVKAPFFAHLLYNELRIAYTRDPRILTAATDGLSIFVNPDFFDTLKIAERSFVLAHEVAHAFLGDLLLQQRWEDEGKVLCPSGFKDYDPAQMNRALDYRINPMLNESKVGKMPACGLLDVNISAKGFESGVEIYDKIFRKSQSGGGYGRPGGGGIGAPGGGFDVHLAPSKQVEQDVASGKRNQAIVAAAEAAQASGQGTIPSAVRRMLGEILDPKVSWQDFLRSTMLRKGGDPMYDWRYLDRRMIGRQPPMYFARQSHSGAGTIVVLYDTSGSCVDPKVQQVFFSEMSGIVADLNPQMLVVIWCDAAVQRVDELEEVEDLEQLRAEINDEGGAPGGGGTDFRPAFEKVAEMGLQPDMVVYLTDTYGTFPEHEPDYPVIWASITPSPKVPWGEVVEVEL